MEEIVNIQKVKLIIQLVGMGKLDLSALVLDTKEHGIARQ